MKHRTGLGFSDQVYACAMNLFLYLAYPKLVIDYVRELAAFPNICLPATVNEKYIWRKIFDHNPQFTLFSDKLATKKYIAQNFPDVPFAKVLWHGNDVRDEPNGLLDGPGYLKANHATSCNLRLGEGSVDRDKLHELSQHWLKIQHHRKHGEWGYKGVPPQLFIEEDLAALGGGPILDITVSVYGHKVTHVVVITDHKTDGAKLGLFDEAGNRLDSGENSRYSSAKSIGSRIDAHTGKLPDPFRLPFDIDEVCAYGRRTAAGSDHLRVDFMWNGERLYLCEITIYSLAGYFQYPDRKFMQKLTQNWDLRRSWFLTTSQTGWRRRYAQWLNRTLGHVNRVEQTPDHTNRPQM